MVAFKTGFSEEHINQINNFVLNIPVLLFVYTAKFISKILVGNGGTQSSDQKGLHLKEIGRTS